MPTLINKENRAEVAMHILFVKRFMRKRNA